MSAPWISVIGLGEDGLDGLSVEALRFIKNAEVLLGGERHQALIGEDINQTAERLTWPAPLSNVFSEFETRRGKRICVLATGDPHWYGIAVTLSKKFGPAEMTVIPAPSAFSLVCARLNWPLAACETLTLHGRPHTLLHPHIYPNARIVILANGRETPNQVAQLLCERGFGGSKLSVLEHIGGNKERMFAGIAESWDQREGADFNTIAVECVAGEGALLLPRMPGLADDAYAHDGQITKREIRALTLSALQPYPGALLWDVGAGAGSIAIEWMRVDPRNQAIAIESNASRINFIKQNAQALGVPGLEIITGTAPGALEGLAPERLAPEGLTPPDAVFIGGGISNQNLFETCWQALRKGGVLVANTVTTEGEARVIALHKAHGGSLTRIDISRSQPLGGFTGWKPMMPVTQWKVSKP